MPITVVSSEAFVYQKDTRKRVLEVTCPLQRIGKVLRSELTASPLPLVHGDPKFCDFRIEHTDGGHIVGLKLGGENSWDNVVPMYCCFNRYNWRLNIENAIAEFDASSSKKLQVRIKLKYKVTDPRIPASFDVRLEELGSSKLVKNFGTVLHSEPVQLTDECSKEDKKTFQSMIVEAKKWSLAGYLQAQSKGLNLPDTPGPYAVLDYMLFVKGFFPAVRVGNGEKFTPEQRRLVLLVNPTIHKTAWVASDDGGDKYPKLTDFGDSGAEIDHIWPKAKSGSNAFSNAQCISSACNKGKTDTF